MFEPVSTPRTSVFERPAPPRQPNTYEYGKTVWDANRNIWQDKQAESDGSRPASARHNSTSSTKFGRVTNGTALAPLDNLRNTSQDGGAAWTNPVGGAVNSRPQTSSFTSPTKRKQSQWLFSNNTELGVENCSSLLAGSAPEFEPFNDDEDGQETLRANRPVRLSEDSGTYENRYMPSHRSSGPSQLPTLNRYFGNEQQYNTSRQNIGSGAKHNSGFSLSDYNGVTMDTSPVGNRVMTSSSMGSSSNAISPTATKFARQANGYLERAHGLDNTIDAFRGLSFGQKPATMAHDGVLPEYMIELQRSPYYLQNVSDPEYHHVQGKQHHENWTPFPNGIDHEVDQTNYGRLQPPYEPNSVANSRKNHIHYVPDHKNSFAHSFHSASITPPTGPGSTRTAHPSANSSRTSPHQLALAERKSHAFDVYQQAAYYANNGWIMPVDHSHYHPARQVYAMGMNPNAAPYAMSSYYAGSSRMNNTRENERAQVIRSPLLQEFHMTHKSASRRWELREVYHHVVEFSGDQVGSRFIQEKLVTANSEEKDQIFKEIQDNTLQLMTDIFGNYVIQKLFEHGNQSQKRALANHMKGHVYALSMQMYGCRVVQKAIEHVLADQQASMIKELDGPDKQILKVIKDQNGNHVVQKAIERVPAQHIQFIIEAHRGDVVKLATHTYGCRVIQRILEHCQPAAKRIILDELQGCIAPLITNQFGNYVVQHIIEKGETRDRRYVVSIVQQQLLIFSKHKFASNVVEKCIEFADDDQRREIVSNLTTPNKEGQSPILGLLGDQYGNYVIQRVHGALAGEEHEALSYEMRVVFPELKKTSYGKQVTAIERLLFGAPQLAQGPKHDDSASSSPPMAPNGVNGGDGTKRHVGHNHQGAMFHQPMATEPRGHQGHGAPQSGRTPQYAQAQHL